MNVGYDNILTSTLQVIKLYEIITVAAADTPAALASAAALLTVSGCNYLNNFVYMDDSLQLA